MADDFVHLSGKHIKLTTDIDDAASNADLIAAFDAAVVQWETFWQFPKGTLDGFQVDACVIRNKERFALAGLIPANVPNFPYGFALQNRVWVMAQKSDYYTRHLLLHEGVHALAFAQFGGTGPSWFMEGTAEMLSVHEGAGAETIVNRVPANRESVPFWGRFKVMSESRQAKSIPTLATVLGYPRDLQSDVNSYGWSWAAVMMLHAYPDTRDAFYAAARNGTRSPAVFNNDLRRDLQDKWPVVEARWRLMCHDLDYGFDWSAENVSLSMNDQVWDGKELSIDVAASRGWQSIGVRLEKGMQISLLPSGQCTLANQPKPWVSEPPGVTIRYHNGRPLGQLIACLLTNPPDSDSTSASSLPPLQVAAITRPAKVPIQENCWLLFRVNDASGELADNTGGYQVKIAAP
ncbi:MAG: hypothetical protein WBD20_01095 [Pirellulaceae bacterium]